MEGEEELAAKLLLNTFSIKMLNNDAVYHMFTIVCVSPGLLLESQCSSVKVKNGQMGEKSV